MMDRVYKSRGTRRVRYTMLLSEDELQTARELAAREVRSLPDYIRWLIIRAAHSEEKKEATVA